MISRKFSVKVAAVLFSALLGAQAYAADDAPAAGAQGKTQADTSAVNPASQNKTPGTESVDDMITNNNLRALSGSTSRWSIASQCNYNGGTISTPLAQDRPDISGASGNTLKSDLDGNISAKYNLDTKNSVLAGVGVRVIAPLTAGTPTNYNGKRFDAMNPYVTYQHVYKWLGIQSVLQVSGTEWTQTDQTALGYARQLNVDQENMYEINKTGLSVGASTAVQYQWFNKSGYYSADIPNLAAVQSQYLFTVAPVVEYQLSDKVNLRTLVNVFTYEHYLGTANKFSFDHDTTYQSIGVGISITRDIFLYPNVQFIPAQIQASNTNVGLGATINLF